MENANIEDGECEEGKKGRREGGVGRVGADLRRASWSWTMARAFAALVSMKRRCMSPTSTPAESLHTCHQGP